MKYFIKILPLIAGLFTALIWSVSYLNFSVLHGMHQMFDQQFPFIIAWVIGVHNENMSQISGAFFAGLDGLLIGSIFGWIAKKIFSMIK